MNIDLDGKLAVFAGARGVISAAIETAITANGARISHVTPGQSLAALSAGEPWPYLLVNVSVGADGIPDVDTDCASELADFATVTRGLAPRLARVVNVFSAAGLVPVKGLAQFSAAQAGLASLTRTLAMELGPDLRVNAVAVGAYDDGRSGVAASRFVGHTAARRPATLDEITAAALFLADPDNGYMTGHTLNVDGGWAAGYARDF